MSTARVRIHRATNFENEPIDVIGVSRSAGGMFDNDRFGEFMAQYGKDAQLFPPGLAVQGGVSSEYCAVRPPFDDEQLAAFGALCVGCAGQRPLVDADDGVYVFDNREPGSAATYDGDHVIAAG